MTYRVQFGPAALRQLHHFPGDALDALVPVMADVSLHPDDPLQTRQVAMVTDVTWAG
jgi:hypothetical protein